MLAVLWIMLGAAVNIWLVKASEEGDPWWLTALLILSWPLLAATQFMGITVTIEATEGDD
jgi:hypothetical protein